MLKALAQAATNWWIGKRLNAAVKRTYMPGQPTLPPPANLTPVYRIGGGMWGHHVRWMDFDDRTIWGHMDLWIVPKFQVGAVLDCEMESGRIALFQITELNWQRDPTDMFFGKVEFIQYKE